MAALDFPASPTVGQQYAAPNGVTYQWDGAAWVVTGGPPGQLWTGAGSTLTPTDPTKQVVIPGPTAAGTGVDQATIVMGPSTRTTKGRVQALTGLDWTGISQNKYYNGSAWVRDDATKAAWTISAAAGGIAFELMSAAGVSSAPLSVNTSDSKTYCTLADTSVTKTMLAVRAACNNLVQAGIPGSSPTNSNAAWVKIVDIGSITVRGGLVIVWWFWNYAYLGNNTQNTIYVGFGRNGVVPGTGQYVRNDFSGSGSALSRWPLQTPLFMEGVAAGTYTYSIWIYNAIAANGAVTCPANDAPGIATVMEFS